MEVFDDLVSARWWVSQFVGYILAGLIGAVISVWVFVVKERYDKKRTEASAEVGLWIDALRSERDLLPIQIDMLNHSRWRMSIHGAVALFLLFTVASTLPFRPNAVGVVALGAATLVSVLVFARAVLR